MIKILVADDNADFVEILGNSLRQKGYEVKSVTQKSELLFNLKSFKPDILLLDVFLDSFDGRQICKEINDSEKLPHIPVIIFSGNPFSLVHYELYGADDYIEKPISLPLLINKIEKLLHKQLEISSN